MGSNLNDYLENEGRPKTIASVERRATFAQTYDEHEPTPADAAGTPLLLEPTFACSARNGH